MGPNEALSVKKKCFIKRRNVESYCLVINFDGVAAVPLPGMSLEMDDPQRYVVRIGYVVSNGAEERERNVRNRATQLFQD